MGSGVATPPASAGAGGLLVASRSAHFPSYVNVGLGQLQNLPLSFDCLALVDKMPRSHGGVVQQVSDDPTLHVAYIKVFREESTILLVYVSNKSDAPLADVKVELKIPDAFAVTYVSEPGQEGTAAGMKIAALAPKCTAIVTVKLQWRKHAVNLATSGSIRYLTARKEPRGTSFTLALGIQDVMRAERVPPNDFAPLWQGSSQEKKVSVPQSQLGSDVLKLSDALKNLLNMHVVSVAGPEVRAASILAGTDKLILVSCTTGLTLNIVVRSNDTFLTDVVLKSLRAVLV